MTEWGGREGLLELLISFLFENMLVDFFLLFYWTRPLYIRLEMQVPIGVLLMIGITSFIKCVLNCENGETFTDILSYLGDYLGNFLFG